MKAKPPRPVPLRDRDWLTLRGVERCFSLSPQSLNKLIVARQLAVYEPEHGRFLVKRLDVERLLESFQMDDANISAANAYRREMDTIGNFLEKCCEVKPHLKVKATDLYNAYIAFSGEKHVTLTAFGLDLNQRGFTTEKDRTGVWRLGLTLCVNSCE
jgi:hypothetical protein